jgi:ribosomal 30S subunit maturation factor RimM
MRPLLAALILPAAAWGQGIDLPDEIAGSEAMAQAATTIAEAGADKVLIADLIGMEVAGPEGEPLGTIEDLAAIPGGRLVAALMTLEDGTPIAVPYAALKVTGARDALEATLPVAAEELSGMAELRDLAAALGG